MTYDPLLATDVRSQYPICLNIRSKHKVFYDLLRGGQPKFFVRWLSTSFL